MSYINERTFLTGHLLLDPEATRNLFKSIKNQNHHSSTLSCIKVHCINPSVFLRCNYLMAKSFGQLRLQPFVLFFFYLSLSIVVCHYNNDN